ncbi:DUF4266 domain-containing protein [Spongiibacter sp. KMU-158]|uniref:DUF4266 domain-containing protein n=2 Tax=Spongiibacter pelagi TaxID=2760804 RepID=A0A927C2B7_9GAMM|nr:DUF4266 domain-containing protein [Spongiibacter pelagi]
MALGLQACGITEVKPWERGYLARPEMAWDPDAQTAAQRSHVYFSKETSNGGATAGGGGCGCN